jgi:hypothetical protein
MPVSLLITQYFPFDNFSLFNFMLKTTKGDGYSQTEKGSPAEQERNPGLESEAPAFPEGCIGGCRPFAARFWEPKQDEYDENNLFNHLPRTLKVPQGFVGRIRNRHLRMVTPQVFSPCPYGGEIDE